MITLHMSIYNDYTWIYFYYNYLAYMFIKEIIGFMIINFNAIVIEA